MAQQSELPKAYAPGEHEDTIYSEWERSGLFNPDVCVREGYVDPSAKTFTVMMPPPNVTGILHLGHALEQSIMDARVRFERMRGKKTLLVPGTDHAAVATQARVEKDLIESGITDPRKELGREELLRRIREYADSSQRTILNQIRKMGTSCDWSRLAYTFDETRSKTVFEAFKRMYDAGLIYRGERVVNWSVVGQCTNSDDELEHVERASKLYTFTYSKDFPIPIATTRPETKLGDTAVAVHPEDSRYKQYIGKTFTVDVGAKEPLSIRVIGDESVDPKFGTGALGVTPAHSTVDFEMMERHSLNMIQVIGTDGRMTDAAGSGYVGLTVEQARDKFVQWLQAHELMIAEEDITQNVSTSQRFGDVVEVLPMTQWFVAVNKEIPGRKKTLKDLMRDAVKTGHNRKKNQKVTINPDRFEKVYFHWVDNLRDWCISRQIWWGHRIPVWYGPNDDIVVSETAPGADYRQDPDTLDTWFSSGTWTFSTLGWPDDTSDMKYFHPTTWIQMGYEILFFWMARMILMSTFILDEVPFYDAYIHGLVRDEQGRKFSKSLRNTLDPLEMIEEYGTDALRLSLIMNVSPGNDQRFYQEKITHYQHFVNKLWNISRFIFGSVDTIALVEEEPEPESAADAWILQQLRKTISYVEEKMEAADFSLAAQLLYKLTWEDFADWYLEVAKVEQETGSKKIKDEILLYVLQALIKAWHPFIPFVTEVIWKQFSQDRMLMVSSWSMSGGINKDYVKKHAAFESVKAIIQDIRNYRAENDIAVTESLEVALSKHTDAIPVIEKLARCSVVKGSGKMSIKETLSDKKRAELESFVTRLEQKLSNEKFVNNAPADVVEQERKKLDDTKRRLGY